MNLNQFVGRWRSAWLLWLWAAAPLPGAVVFSDIPDIPFFADNLVFNADLDNNGTTDAVFRNFTNEFAVFATPTSRIAGITAVPPNQNSFAAAFIGGDIIGSALPSIYAWNTGYSGLIGCRDIGCLGLWGSKDAYLGVQFEIDGGTHYGWVQIDTPFDFGGGFIKAFAYESEPDKPILAGTIPEPSSLVGIGLAVGFALTSRRKVIPLY